MIKAHSVVPGDEHIETGIKVKVVVPVTSSAVTKVKKLLITFEDSTTTLVGFNDYVSVKKPQRVE